MRIPKHIHLDLDFPFKKESLWPVVTQHQSYSEGIWFDKGCTAVTIGPIRVCITWEVPKENLDD